VFSRQYGVVMSKYSASASHGVTQLRRCQALHICRIAKSKHPEGEERAGVTGAGATPYRHTAIPAPPSPPPPLPREAGSGACLRDWLLLGARHPVVISTALDCRQHMPCRKQANELVLAALASRKATPRPGTCVYCLPPNNRSGGGGGSRSWASDLDLVFCYKKLAVNADGELAFAFARSEEGK
jgi:hypothetical protein